MRLFLLFTFLLIVSCKHFPTDQYANHAENNYKRIEFDIVRGDSVKKEMGFANIFLTSNDQLNDYYIDIYGIYTGTLYIKSPECSIDVTQSFNGITRLKLSELFHFTDKCSIDIIAETSKIQNNEHKIVESGTIKVYPIENIYTKPVKISYDQTNSFILEKTYEYLGQASMQRMEGELTSNEVVSFETESKSGLYRIVGCDFEITGRYSSNKFKVPLKDIYTYYLDEAYGKKDYLKITDSCDFNISMVAEDTPYSYNGRLTINIYGLNIVKLEPLTYKIKGKKLEVSGNNYVLGCAVGDKYCIDNICSINDYKSDVEYWIRAITTNGRKSVFSIKNGKINWRE